MIGPLHARDPLKAARSLLGMELHTGLIHLRITEVEAYGGPEDSASHARFGITDRTWPMWEEAGTSYVYLCYGIHWMFNVVTGPKGQAAAALVRSCEILEGREEVVRRRGRSEGDGLLAGPGKVGQGLGLRKVHSGLSLLDPGPGGIALRPGRPPSAVVQGPRVGIGFASELDQLRLARFADRESAAVTQVSGLS